MLRLPNTRPRWWHLLRRWKTNKWVEATEHDVSIMPGGYVLHHSTCWCKSRLKPQSTNSKLDTQVAKVYLSGMATLMELANAIDAIADVTADRQWMVRLSESDRRALATARAILKDRVDYVEAYGGR